jgi:hypothetical protein
LTRGRVEDDGDDDDDEGEAEGVSDWQLAVIGSR